MKLVYLKWLCHCASRKDNIHTVIHVIHNSFIIYVPSQQLQANYRHSTVNNNNNTILYYLRAELTAIRPITDTAQCTCK
jgi:hypothetical protein